MVTGLPPSWRLLDCYDSAGLHSSLRERWTGFIPTKEARAALGPRDVVQLLIVEAEEPRAMPVTAVWVTVQGKRGTAWLGRLHEPPWNALGLAPGELIEFNAGHVADILTFRHAPEVADLPPSQRKREFVF